MLRPAQASIFRRFVGVERNAQLTVDFPTERRGNNQLRAVLQLQFVGHQHTHFVCQHLIKLLKARQDCKVQHHQVGRHQADKQQGDDQ